MHSPLSSPGTLTNMVSMGVLGAGVTHGLVSGVKVVAPPLPEPKYACSLADPPAGAAGLTQAAIISGAGTRPNNEPFGGGALARNEA